MSLPNSFGILPRVTVFGQSHDAQIGTLIEGLPPGIVLDMEQITTLLQRRKGGDNALTTSRKEADIPQIQTGVKDGITTGRPLKVTFTNRDTRSGDYEQFRTIPRPSHADYLAILKYGNAHDIAGGGRFSGRLTLPLCFAGAICLQILDSQGIAIHACLTEVAGKCDDFETSIIRAREDNDSVGGVVEFVATGLPAGVGQHPFGGVEPLLSHLLFAIPGARGVEFGEGFGAARMRGSEHNDPWICKSDGLVRTATNHAGGIVAGMTTGMPVVGRVAFKPTASIGLPQKTLNLTTGQTETLVIKGRHDPCIALRAIPVVEATVAIGLLNLINLDSRKEDEGGGLDGLRHRIDALDDTISELFYRRMELVEHIRAYKSQTDTPVRDRKREQEIIERLSRNVTDDDATDLANLYQTIFEISRRRQTR